MAKIKMQGVWTALVTPFRDGELDQEAYKALCDRQVRAGIHGLVPCGTTGETPTLSLEEWLVCVKIAIRAAGGRIPVIAGCGTNATRSTLERIRLAQEAGADGALVVTPYYNKPSPDGLRAHFVACAKIGLPIVIYHIPGRTAQRLPVPLLAELCKIPGVVGCKEATGDLNDCTDLIAATATPVLSGDDPTFLALCAIGGTGVISVLSDIAPRGTVAIWDALRRGDIGEAALLHYKYLPLMRWLFHTTSPAPCKALLAAGGLCANELRLPLVALEKPVPQEFLALLEA